MKVVIDTNVLVSAAVADRNPENLILEVGTMQKITLRSRVGEDGILHLDIPIEIKDTDLEVTVIVKSVKKNRYNAWGKLVTRNSVQDAITGMRRLQKKAALTQSNIQEMKEEGRRF